MLMHFVFMLMLMLQCYQASRQGHILVFLTGREEIDRACRCILSALGPEAASDRLGDLLQHRHDRDDDGNSKKRRPDRMLVVPLHSTLSMDQQRLAFAKVPHYVRKCVVATNIAETSITVPHVRYVVDCGFVKQKTYDPTRHLESLVVVPVSQTAAQQRAGRAGRTGQFPLISDITGNYCLNITHLACR
jgi:ATP-dependent RNA helicase DHX8/PRP22